MLYERFGDLKFKYRNREFWCRGYYVDTVGKNKEKIRDYIKKQLEEDKLGTQLCLLYLQSCFVPSDDLDALIKISGNLVDR